MTGRLDLKVPCKNCPFGDRPFPPRIRFSCPERAKEIAESAYRNGFPCHLSANDTSDEDEDGGFVFTEGTQHCVGAIGMFLNSGYDTWPGVDNDESISDDGRYAEARKIAFQSEDEFIDANAAEEE